jgi:hypothetical protein
VKKVFFVLLTQLVIYLMMFFVIPLPHPDDTTQQTVMISLITIFVSIVAVVFSVDKARYWAIGLPVLWGLIILYHPDYAYGLGWRPYLGLRWNLNEHIPTGAFLIALNVFILQCILCWCKLGIVSTNKKKKSKSK